MSYTPTPNDIKRLREETGAGIMDCKKALSEAGGDFEEARELLRKWGLAGIRKRSGREASEGAVETYLHRPDPDLPARVGVLVELNCETDFVAKTPDFRKLARDIAMHVAWVEPRWISRNDVPEDFVEREKKILMESDELAGKKPEIVEKIVEGKIQKLLADQGGVLLDQVFIRDETGKQTVADVIGQVAANVKENVVVRRFARFKLGEGD